VHGAALEAVARRVLETGEPVLGIDVANANGRHHHIVSYYPVPGPDGRMGVGTSVTDVTHLKDVERKLEETNRSLAVLATTDELTQLPNRRMFVEQLDLALARARRGGLAVAVLCVDLDNFKHVNDTLGHGFGDQLLFEIGGRLRAGARETDVVARIGGDEFVILLADLDSEDSQARVQIVVDRLRGLLAETLAIGPVEVKVEASIGVAVYPFDSRDAKGLLAVADAAMYAGKSTLVRIA
jgi:diguanylate cyclase (GGDEF)-like protein